MNEGTTAEAQLVTLLGFVVVQSFHGSLRLSGKTRRKKVRRTRAEGGGCIPWHIWFLLGSGRLQSKVTVPSAGEVVALQRRQSPQKSPGNEEED